MPCRHNIDCTETECLYSCSHWSNLSPDEVCRNHTVVMEEYYRKNLVGVPCELDIPYGGMPLQQVDIWGHENESLHAVVLFHGGYWQSDSRKLFTSLVKPLTNANIVVACVDYEMATTSPISALVEQCADSLKFLRNRWPNKQIVVGGHSAGAHLALSALLRANAKQHNIARIILFSGIYDLRLLPDTYIGKAIGLTVYDAVRNTIETSEVCSFIGAVKFYVGSIESPVFIEESKRIAAWMKQSSHVDVHLSIVCSQDHFSLVGKLGEPSSTICEEIIHFILTTYIGYVVSRLITRYFGCLSVQLGRCGFFYISHLKISLKNGLIFEIDDLRLSSSFFSAEYTKPLMLLVNDVRIESEGKWNDNFGFDNQSKHIRSPMDAERYSHLLQYIGVRIQTGRIFYLDSVPGCLLHSTFEVLQMDTYRYREGIQLEVYCRLAQAKLLSRDRVNNSVPLSEMTLGFQISADLPLGRMNEKRLSISLNDPLLSLSDGCSLYIREHATLLSESSPSAKKIDCVTKLLSLLRSLPVAKCTVENFMLRYLAYAHVEKLSRSLSASVRKLCISSTTDNQLSIAMTAVVLNDQSSCTHLNLSDFMIICYGSPDTDASKSYLITLAITVLNPSIKISANDLAFWTEYFVYMKSFHKPRYGFEDDFTPIHDSDSTVIRSASEIKNQAVETACFSISIEVNTLSCALHLTDNSNIHICANFITLKADEMFEEVEFGVEYLSVCFGKQSNNIETFSFDRHSWGTIIMIGAMLIRYDDSKGERRLRIEIDECHLEYTEQLAKQIDAFMSVFLRLKSSFGAETDSWSNVMSASNSANDRIYVKLVLNKFALFIVSRRTHYIMTASEKINLKSVYSSSIFIAVVEDLRFGRGRIEEKRSVFRNAAGDLLTEFKCGSCDRLLIQAFHLETMREVYYRFESSAFLAWHPVAHKILLEAFQSIKSTIDKHFTCGSMNEVKKFHVAHFVESDYPMILEFHLPRDHLVRWEASSLYINNTAGFCISMSCFIVLSDGHNILTIKKFCVNKKLADSQMDLGRAEFKNLQDHTNRVWSWSADSVDFVFPYDYDFASSYDEFINAWKWIKIVHSIYQNPFTIDSPLPSDICFSIKKATLQLNDDPFEVKLYNNYELMVDEVYECERRRQMLNQKLEQLLKVHPFLSQTKMDELLQTLIKKNSEIYIERSRRAPVNRVHLIIWTVSNISIHAYADHSLHGKDNAVKYLRLFNPEAPFPEDGMEFSTLWARAVEIDFEDWIVQLRDYPLPCMVIRNAHFWGYIVGAEHLAGDRSTRHCVVELPDPWGEYVINRNMCPLKFYYDIESEIQYFNFTYGPCWIPCLSMVSLCWQNVRSVSKDLSEPLPFWDKIRLLLHGRISLLCRNMVTAILASTDPYNSTEYVEISWKNMEFDWMAGQIFIRTDVNAFVRTASKYDECRVLHLPGFKLSIQVIWRCRCDPQDHHNAQPRAPDKLPEYHSTNREHDSYRSFRSLSFDLLLNLDVKQPTGAVSDNQCPHILLYSNTFSWLEFLKNTMTTVNRPIKRRLFFKSKDTSRAQLSRHCRHIQLSLSLPRFLISYWMSFSSSHGFRMISESLHLTSSIEFYVSSIEDSTTGVTRRKTPKWSISHVSVQLLNAQIHLFGDSSRPMREKFTTESDDKSFFLGLSHLSYIREASHQEKKVGEKSEASERTAVHRLTIHDLRASWTPNNRDTCLAIADGIQKAHILRRILNTNDIMKNLHIQKEDVVLSQSRRAFRSKTKINNNNSSSDADKSPIRLYCDADSGIAEGNDMLQKLIEESETKLVAYSEEATDVPSDQLHGIALCSTGDEFLLNWQIDLINSQAMLRGKEVNGFILLTAAKASVTQRIHLPVWKKSQLLSKRSWCAILSGMQYFAPLLLDEPHNLLNNGVEKEQFHWLSRDVIEEKACSNPSINDRLDNYISAGEAVGGVVTDQSSDGRKSQLQRVVSRCSCQLYFCYFSDALEIDSYHVPLPLEEDCDEESEIWARCEGTDCFTLKHNMLEVSSTPQQYEMAMNIVNQLVLFVDPRKTKSEGNRQRLKFQWQLKTLDEVKVAISAMQAELRDLIAVIRSLDRRSFFHNRRLMENPNDSSLLEMNKEVILEIEDHKRNQLNLIDELAMTISCYKEKQVEMMHQHRDLAEDVQALVARRFEVCFEDCIWRLTESDGQIALAEMQIRNFLYTRTARIDNSGEHLLEIGTVKVTNLLPDSIYRHTLQAQNTSSSKMERQSSVRVFCRDMAPVGGISVKQHFEVNVAPMVAQFTYRFFEKIMAYFFPGRNIDKEDQQNLDMTDEQQAGQSVSVAQWLRGAVNGSFRRNVESHQLRDDIDRMKERAQKNNVFLYIKIPEVPFIVSYKGNKDKNIEDVDRFQLIFPLCEYHDKNWTWLDLALAIKQRCKRVLLQQFMKQKLLRNRLMGVERAPSEVDEEEKKRIVLGTAIAPDKSKKKIKNG